MMGDSNIDIAEICTKHGINLKKALCKSVSDWCPECSTENQTRRDQEEMERRKTEHFEHMKSRLISVARLPDRFSDCSFDNYEPRAAGQQSALNQCQEFVQSVIAGNDNSLILSGAVGTGKTHLGCAIANAIIGRIIDRQCFDVGNVHYLTVPSLINEVRATWGNYGSSEDEILDRYGHSYLLILDEAGVQRGSDDEHRILFGVINRRYENQLPTVVITNLAVSSLGRAMGERVVDRLRENGKAVTFDWPSYRKQAHLAV